MSWATLAFRRADFFVGFSLHEAFFPPLPPVPYYPHVSFGFVTGVTQLFSLPSCGNHKNITSNGLHLMGRMTDAFPIVPHVSFPPQLGLVMTTLFGSSNMVWGSSSVELKCWTPFSKHGQKSDIATALGYCVSPHLSCNEPISFLFDLACVTDSTTMVGMSLGDFLAALTDIAIQLAMEIGLKFLMAGAKTAWKRLSSSKKILEADKFVKFSDAFDAVQAGKQVDELTEHGWHLNEAASDAAKKTKDLAEEAEKSGVYKYGAKQMAKKEAAESTILDMKALKSQYEEALNSGRISKDAFDEMTEEADNAIVEARYAAKEAGNKLDQIDDAWYETFWKQLKNAMSKGESDKFIASTEEAGTWKAWHNAYLDGSKEWYYKLYGCYDATTNFLQAWAKNGDSWYHLVMYSFFRRLTGRTWTIGSSIFKLATPGNTDSADQNLFYYWGNRQDFIDEINGAAGDSGTETGSSGSVAGLFGWVNPEIGSTGTSTRFGWAGGAAGGGDDQWADPTFNASTTDRFGWVSTDT